MGIFSLFGKKQHHWSAKNAASVSAHAIQGSERRQSALATAASTALKIDAIESEMSSEFVPSVTSALNKATNLEPISAAQPALVTIQAPLAQTLPLPESPLLADTIVVAALSATMVEDVPLFEEAAILFANGQTQMVEYLLKEAIDTDSLGTTSVTAWAMLFDLYQTSGHRDKFEHLSIAYASRFESSPPPWMAWVAPQAAETLARAPLLPPVVFQGRLDAGIVKALGKLRDLAKKHPAIRLEFTRITEVDPIGCGLLLRVLRQMKKSGIDLVLVGAPELVKKIKAILVVGRRDETEAPWLLLLELLEMMNLEVAFEETSIDYCVTFEVSPPAFGGSENKIIRPLEQPVDMAIGTDVFAMPALIEGRADALVLALNDFILRYNPARVDCGALMRIDVNAAGQLQAGLASLCNDDRTIEFFNVNYLVAGLFNVVGFKNLVRISARKI